MGIRAPPWVGRSSLRLRAAGADSSCLAQTVVAHVPRSARLALQALRNSLGPKIRPDRACRPTLSRWITVAVAFGSGLQRHFEARNVGSIERPVWGFGPARVPQRLLHMP